MQHQPEPAAEEPSISNGQSFQLPGSIRGFQVRARDGDIGRIDEHSSTADGGYIIVDTRSWTWGKRRLIADGVIEHIDYGQQMVFVRMLKAQIRGAPEFDDAERNGGDRCRPSDLRYYEPYSQ